MDPKDLAMAYSLSRRNRKKMARGGVAREMPEPDSMELGSEGDLDHDERASHMEMVRDLRMKLARGGLAMLDEELPEDEYSKNGIINYALGGSVSAHSDEDMHPRARRFDQGEGMRDQRASLREENPSISHSIRKKLAFGGSADSDAMIDNATEHTNLEDDLSYDLADEQAYDERSALEDVGEASNANRESHGMSDEDSGDEYDMVSSLKRKMKGVRK